MKFIDLFAGLGGFHIALSALGHKCVYACELSDSLRKIYKKNFNINIDGDITKLDIKKIPQHEILCAGFPCQPFSKAGNSQGFNHKIAGKMFFYLIKIIKFHKPKFLFLENVPNLLNHSQGKTWSFMKKQLSKLGYEVDQKVVSPIDFNIPQTRNRMYIVAKKDKLNGFTWPKKLKPKNNLKKYLSNNPKLIKEMSEQRKNAIKTWKFFLTKMPKTRYLPSPLWSMEFGATYPFENTTPLKMKLKDLKKKKGKFGVSFKNMNKEEILKNLPNYSKVKTVKYPDWKIKMIKKTRDFYKENKKWVDKLIPKLIDLKSEAYQKFEWNCQGDKFNFTGKIISFRPSGVRVRRNNSAPTLISSTTSQVPYLAWKKRFMSYEECLNIQGMEKLKYYPKTNGVFFPAIGNAVNVKVVYKIGKELFN